MRVLTAIFILLFFYGAQAQNNVNFDPNSITVAPDEINLDQINIENIQSFPAVSNFHNFLPVSIENKFDSEYLYGNGKDTLSEYVERSSGFAVYSLTDTNNNTLFLTGTNRLFYFLGMKFETTEAVDVEGFLIAYAASFKNQIVDTLALWVFPGSPINGLPNGNLIGGGTFVTNQLDTNVASPNFTYLPLSTVATVNGNFVAMVQTQRGRDDDDLTVIFSNIQGDGKGENKSCVFFAQNNNLVAADLSILLSAIGINVGGQPIDFDLFIMPVIQSTTTGVAIQDVTIDGLTINNVYPNPAVNFARIDVSAESSGTLVIHLIGMDGRIVRTREENLSEGTHSLNFDLSGIAPGNYFISFVKGTAKVGAKITIAR